MCWDSCKVERLHVCSGDMKALVHWDDFVSLGDRSDLTTWPRRRVLKRIVRWHARKRITCDADPRHAEIIIRETRSEEVKLISTQAAKDTGRETEEEIRHDLSKSRLSGNLGCRPNDDDGDALSPDDVTRYRRTIAGSHFLAQENNSILNSRVDDKRRIAKTSGKMTSSNVCTHAWHTSAQCYWQ